MEENIPNENNIGVVKISDEVVEVIAGLAATEIKGVVGMSGKLAGGITQIFTGKKNISKGVKVNVGEESASIDLYIVVKYGIKIPDVALSVQKNVKKTVETMTGLNVSAVNIFVQNVYLPKNEEKEESEN